MKRRESRFRENVIPCSNWAAVVQAFNELPKPTLRRHPEGDAYQTLWIFRGQKDHRWRLQPSIELAYPCQDWPEIEYKVLGEFQSKAPMHMDPASGFRQ